MEEKKPLCHKCRHNVKNTSCGNKVGNLIDNITEAAGLEVSPQENDIDFLKLTCKVLMNNPEETNSIDPTNCRYFMNAAYRFN